MGNLHKKSKKPLEKIFKSLYYNITKTIKCFSKNKTEEYTVPILSNGIGENALYGFTDIAKIKAFKNIIVSPLNRLWFLSKIVTIVYIELVVLDLLI